MRAINPSNYTQSLFGDDDSFPYIDLSNLTPPQGRKPPTSGGYNDRPGCTPIAGYLPVPASCFMYMTGSI